MKDDLSDAEKRLLRRCIDLTHRLSDHDRLVASLISEVAKLQRDKQELSEKMRGDLEIRRIAALNGIPQQAVIEAFQQWLRTQDFETFRKTRP